MGFILTFLVPRLPGPLFSPYDGGPLGYRPQLEASAVSPDGTFSVKVFRQRSPSHSWYLGAEMHVRVYDDRERVVYEKMIGIDGAWSELDDAFQDIKFEGDTICISQLWGRASVIKRSEFEK